MDGARQSEELGVLQIGWGGLGWIRECVDAAMGRLMQFGIDATWVGVVVVKMKYTSQVIQLDKHQVLLPLPNNDRSPECRQDSSGLDYKSMYEDDRALTAELTAGVTLLQSDMLYSGRWS